MNNYNSGVIAERNRIAEAISDQIAKYQSERITNGNLSHDTRKKLKFEIMGLQLALGFCFPEEHGT